MKGYLKNDVVLPFLPQVFYAPDNDNVWLVSSNGSGHIVLNLPFGTYGATFDPTGDRILYTASPGFGKGSKVGVLDLNSNTKSIWQTFTDQNVAFPRWSPDGNHLVYTLMADNNIPYSLGELWQADAVTGAPVQMLTEVEAGHGFSPVWAPDSSRVVYVGRDNPDIKRANYDPYALHSNLYSVEIASGRVTQLTQFEQSMVYGTAWAPNGEQLAFTVERPLVDEAATYLLTLGQPPVQISFPDTIARHPVWLAVPDSE